MQYLRLGFHDCIPNNDSVTGKINGCDGCFNPVGMGVNMHKMFPKKENPAERAKDSDGAHTSNNGLWFTADVLEEVYTNPEFPIIPGEPNVKLEMSMKHSGKSRADLWAFAGLIAATWGMTQSNRACVGDRSGSGKKKFQFFYLSIHFTSK